jgi:uncharacterized repeat protein (TIGR04052 family)
VFVLGCGGASDGDVGRTTPEEGENPPNGVDEEGSVIPTEPEVRTEPVELRFEAVLGDAPVACGDVLQGVGEMELTRRLSELRFFVGDVALLDENGSAVAVSLTDDGVWQQPRLGVVDLDDAEGSCSGSPGEHAILTGEVPEGNYSGIRFRVGVPSNMTEADLAGNRAPLDRSDMQWPWAPAYNFFFLAVTTEDPEGLLPSSGSAETGIYSTVSIGGFAAASEDGADVWLPAVQVDGFEPSRDVLQVDLRAILQNLDLTTGGACMGSNLPPFPPMDGCSEALTALGLDPVTGANQGEQTVFSVR